MSQSLFIIQSFTQQQTFLVQSLPVQYCNSTIIETFHGHAKRMRIAYAERAPPRHLGLLITSHDQTRMNQA